VSLGLSDEPSGFDIPVEAILVECPRGASRSGQRAFIEKKRVDRIGESGSIVGRKEHRFAHLGRNHLMRALVPRRSPHIGRVGYLVGGEHVPVKRVKVLAITAVEQYN
jgi:hypothetical protein